MSKYDVVSFIVSAYLGSPVFEKRFELAWYLDRCCLAGICNSDNEARLLTDRWFKGKRKVTKPGTVYKKKQEKELKKLIADVPENVSVAIKEVSYSHGDKLNLAKEDHKLLNFLVGQVLKKVKTNPVLVRKLFILKFNI